MSRTFAPPIYRALEGRIDKQTEKAILFTPINKQTGEEFKAEWFPKSQLVSFGGTYDEVDGTFNYILASEWILGQKALLSKSIPRDLIKIIPKESVPSSKISGVTKQDREDRKEFKDDEGGAPDWDAYYEQFGHPEDE